MKYVLISRDKVFKDKEGKDIQYKQLYIYVFDNNGEVMEIVPIKADSKEHKNILLNLAVEK